MKKAIVLLMSLLMAVSCLFTGTVTAFAAAEWEGDARDAELNVVYQESFSYADTALSAAPQAYTDAFRFTNPTTQNVYFHFGTESKNYIDPVEGVPIDIAIYKKADTNAPVISYSLTAAKDKKVYYSNAMVDQKNEYPLLEQGEYYLVFTYNASRQMDYEPEDFYWELTGGNAIANEYWLGTVRGDDSVPSNTPNDNGGNDVTLPQGSDNGGTDTYIDPGTGTKPRRGGVYIYIYLFGSRTPVPLWLFIILCILLLALLGGLVWFILWLLKRKKKPAPVTPQVGPVMPEIGPAQNTPIYGDITQNTGGPFVAPTDIYQSGNNP